MNHPEILKMQAEAAVRKLSEARLHERTPKACKQCSQKHRKCQFKMNQSKCDLCAKNNRECEILPFPASLSRKSDDRASPVSPQSLQLDSMLRMPSSSAYDRNEPSYPSASSSSNPTDPRNPRSHMSSYAYSPSNDYQYSPTSSNASISPGIHETGYLSAQQQQQGVYPQYAPNLGHGRDSGQYYPPPHEHGHASPPNFVPSQHWASETHRNGEAPQSAPPPPNQSYAYQGTTHQASMLRQASPTSPHPGAGQPYVRTAQAYQAASPASQGGPYSVAGNSMYQMPVSSQTTPARYGAGSSQAYHQGSNSVVSTSAYYQQGMHQ